MYKTLVTSKDRLFSNADPVIVNFKVISCNVLFSVYLQVFQIEEYSYAVCFISSFLADIQ